MEIKVKNLLQIFNGSEFSIYCERPETTYGYEELYNSNWVTGVPRAIMETTVLSCKVEDGTFCIKVGLQENKLFD